MCAGDFHTEIVCVCVCVKYIYKLRNEFVTSVSLELPAIKEVGKEKVITPMKPRSVIRQPSLRK